jgi:hypothetical protein
LFFLDIEYDLNFIINHSTLLILATKHTRPGNSSLQSIGITMSIVLKQRQILGMNAKHENTIPEPGSGM